MRLYALPSRSALLLASVVCLLNATSPAYVLADSATAVAETVAATEVAPAAVDAGSTDAITAVVSRKESARLTTDHDDSSPETPPGPPVAGASAAKSAKATAPTDFKTPAAGKILKGAVTEDGKKTPFLPGVVQTIPKSTTVELTMCGNLNSEISQKGDEVLVQIGRDVPSSRGVGVPGGWYAHGLVTDAASQKRLGRDGYIVVEFDKIVSPDGQFEVPFHATFSTKDKLLKTVAKQVAIDTGYVSYGAVGGALMSLQITGIPMAVASHGYSVVAGAAAGATLGAIGALKRKGNVASVYPGDMMKLITAEPISLPGFDRTQLPSGQVHKNIENMAITINKVSFSKDPNGDKSSSLLTVDLNIANKTEKACTFFDLAVVSDLNQRYLPSIFGGFQQLQKTVKPNTKQEGVVTFEVEGKKRKYSLVLLDRTKSNELCRVPIN